MKDFLEKLLIYIGPYFLLISICYNNGYWSPYPINVYDYYQVGDIIKAIALPSFSFFSLSVVPLLVFITTLVSILKENKTPQATINNIEKIKYRWIRVILKFIIYCLIPAYLIYALTSIGAVISPYFDDRAFSEMYFSGISTSLIRSIVLAIAYPLLLSLVLGFINDAVETNIPIAKSILLTASLLSIFIIAYHSGRFDSFKIISGYRFYYSLDNRNIPHKYLGKLDKYFFFLDDDKIISPKGSMNMRIDTMKYTPYISIISEDSMKFLHLKEYGTFNTIQSAGLIEKVFTVRNLNYKK